jgi:inosine-uridine nucleoside N-ribohydrolase
MITAMRIAFDMETLDPDDALTLCLLATHPAVELAAVSVNPGSRVQVGLVRRLLERLGAGDVPIGARDPRRASGTEVSAFHFAWLGAIDARDPDMPAHEVLAQALGRDPATVLLSGAPLHNVRDLLREHPDVRVDRWVVQGGFAGDNVVPERLRLAKFAGKTSTESHNFGANKKATLAVLADPRIRDRRLVAKNVTHAVVWDASLQAEIGRLDAPTVGVRLMHEAMAVYLREHPGGKLMHDPLAACAAIDCAIIEWMEIEVTYGGGRWGAQPASDSGTFISIDVDRTAFLRTLVAPATWPPVTG